MTTIQRLACLCLNMVWMAVLMSATTAQAQTSSTIDWGQGTTLSGFAGAASVTGDTDAAAGVSLGWEITPRFGLEGRGVWLRAGDTEDAFAATLAARVAIRPARPFVPFASAGVGMYRASFDTASGLPEFYRNRLSAGAVGGQTFTDFALTFGGGADFFVTRHLALRPEVNVLLVMTQSDVRAVTVYGAQIAYHFESHPITP
jgi:opacity protein-like surface antigen